MNNLTEIEETFARYLAGCPVIAILRGVKPDEVVEIGKALISAGIRIIEVPLNSPEPFQSIRNLSSTLGEAALIGAGTVLRVDDVEMVAQAGGRLVVSPNTDPKVIAATVSANMISAPGFFTPTEAFAAIEAGAHAIKLFPAEAATPAVVKAQRAVLPHDVPLLIVGGVTAEDVNVWRSAGADGFGLGGALYRPGQSAGEVSASATRFVTALGQRGPA
jgi:2-dehydro-3-deoxyphosphogalactonate aldolase